MNVLMIITLILLVPVMLIPVILIWYINLSGMKELYHKETKAVRERN